MGKQQISMRQMGIDAKQINKAALEIVRKLHSNNHEAYLVGGAVRDLLFGLKPKDFDVATSARPEQIRRIFRRSWIIGRRFRLVHVRIKNELVEVATFRTLPSKKNIAATGQLVIDNNFGDDAQEDALRRDLTVNGLMLEPESGMIHDYVNGIPDIQSRKMRVIGDPEARYQEDPVRMLRILRLAAKLQCTVADSSLQPIASNADILANIVPARLLEEVIKLVHCKYSRNGFELCRTHNLLAQLFPNTKHYSDAQWKFCEQALANNDRAMHEGKQISLSLVCSALYWPMISQSWQDTACHNRRSNVMKMRQYYDKSGVLTNPILSRIIRARIWEIWEYQARFHGLYKRRKALTIRPNYAVSKGLEFLRLRHHFDEVPEEKIQWWQTFISANKQQREDMVPSKKSTNKTSKKTKAISEHG